MKSSAITKFALLLALFALALPAAAQVTAEQKAAVDSLFKEWDTNETPGAAVGVIRDGKLIYARGYGMADLEHDVPITPQSVFYMASVSKQFVTFAILLLEEQGKLGLDDEIQKHLPDFPRYKDPLTIRHFIHHTSGVRDSLTLWSLTGKDIYDSVSKEAMYDLLKRQKELNFKPGERYLYSNACYFMLALIVEKASGKSIRDFAEEHMFKPLGMKNTHFHDDQYHIVKNRVFSYEPGKNGYRNLIMRFDLVGSGGLYSSIGDLLLWDQNFYDNKLGKGRQELIDTMLTDGRLNNGSSAGYAFGISNGTHNGLRTVQHGGALAGYRTFYLRYPDENFSVFVLANAGNFNAGGKSRSIGEIFLKDKFKKPTANEAAADDSPNAASADGSAVGLAADEMKAFTGNYFSRDGGISVKITLEEKGLMHQLTGGPVVAMKPLGENRFKLDDPNREIFLTFEKSGAMNAVVNGGAPIGFVSFEPVTYSADDLKRFAGTYFSEEINTYYHLKVEKDELIVYVNDTRVDALKVIMKNLFKEKTNGYFEFSEDPNGRITGFALDAGRVKNLQFKKR